MNNELYDELKRTSQLAPQGGNQLQQATKKALDEAKYALNPFRSDPNAPQQEAQPAAVESTQPGLGFHRGASPSPSASMESQPPLQSAQAPGSPLTDRLNTPQFKQVAPANTAPVNPVTQIGNGMSLSHDREGNRIYTAGVKDQPGYGYMKVMPGSGNASVGAPAMAQAPRQVPAGARGYAVQGNAGDKAAFNRPVSGPAAGGGPGAPAAIPDKFSPDYSFLKPDSERTGGMPKYLGKESGLGWKTRLGIYREQMDAYNKATGGKNALDIASMQEAGAGGRAMLAAQGVNDRNAIEAQQLQTQKDQFAAGDPMRQVDLQEKQMGLGYSKQVQGLRDKLMASTDPNEQKTLMRQLYAMQGKPDNQKYQIVSKKGVAADGMTPTETNYAVNPDDPGQSFEIGAGGGNGDPMAMLKNDPQAMAAFSKLSPQDQKIKMDLMRKRMAGSY